MKIRSLIVLVLAVLIVSVGVVEASFFLPAEGSWSDEANWDTGLLPGTDDWVFISDTTATIDSDAGSVGVLNLGYNDDLSGVSRLNIVDGGSLTTINNGGWDMIGGQNTGATELNMSGASTYSCQGWLIFNHHSVDASLISIGSDAELHITQQLYLWNGDSSTNLQGTLIADGGFVFGTASHVINLQGGTLLVGQAAYSEADAQAAVGSFLLGDDIAISTVDMDGVLYTQVTGVLEPATMLLLGLGGLGLVRRRKQA